MKMLTVLANKNLVFLTVFDHNLSWISEGWLEKIITWWHQGSVILGGSLHAGLRYRQ